MSTAPIFAEELVAFGSILGRGDRPRVQAPCDDAQREGDVLMGEPVLLGRSKTGAELPLPTSRREQRDGHRVFPWQP